MISGTTKYYAQLADPVEHVKFPGLMQRYFDAAGLDIAAIPLHVAPGGLEDAVRGLRAWQNLLAVGVTMPHKEAIVPLLDSVTPRAAAIGSVNEVLRNSDGTLCGDMVDGAGFVRGVESVGHQLKDHTVQLVGAGGTARAVAFAIAEAGAKSLHISNRTMLAAERLAADVAKLYADCVVTAGAANLVGKQIVVNGTSLGMSPTDPLPIDLALREGGAVVAEVVASPPETALLAAAAGRGNPVVSGLAMLDAQVPMVFELLGLDFPGWLA